MFWSSRGVPSEPPHPLMGSLTFPQRENVGVWMRKLYTRFDSSYVGIWLFWRPALVINSPEIARRVLVKDADVFRNRFLSSGKSDPIGGMNIFTVNDPVWTAVRRRLTVVFTGSKLRAMQELIIRKADDFVQRIHREIQTGEPIHIREQRACGYSASRWAQRCPTETTVSLLSALFLQMRQLGIHGPLARSKGQVRREVRGARRPGARRAHVSQLRHGVGGEAVAAPARGSPGDSAVVREAACTSHWPPANGHWPLAPRPLPQWPDRYY
ncbi:hypothetical protein K1T71_000549 [Dendrolimus kikuchii]|uniref:Uncharacterized protein n=1 Tax=Dendrolimus kikuchii TaxID=765133 RepID=A0ACC1DKT9_9NEOP|nr:hypothetical protein K1T71_000549 [Dendrolimus kikuchii]